MRIFTDILNLILWIRYETIILDYYNPPIIKKFLYRNSFLRIVGFIYFIFFVQQIIFTKFYFFDFLFSNTTCNDPAQAQIDGSLFLESD